MPSNPFLPHCDVINLKFGQEGLNVSSDVIFANIGSKERNFHILCETKLKYQIQYMVERSKTRSIWTFKRNVLVEAIF